MKRRTLTMDWDGLGDDDDDDEEDLFFESNSRISSIDPAGLCSSGSDEDQEFEDSRMSFVSAISTASACKGLHSTESFAKPQSALAGYDMWMSEPGDVKERRRRLLQGMGLASSRAMMRIASRKAVETDDFRISSANVDLSPIIETKLDHQEPTASASPSTSSRSPPHSHPHPTPVMIARSTSDGDIVAFSDRTKQAKEELIDPASRQKLTRSSSEIVAPNQGLHQYSNSDRASPLVAKRRSSIPNNDVSQPDGAPCLIKNLDSGKEFVVKEYNKNGLWNKLREIQTGNQLTMEEFEKSAGSSPVVKEYMSRQNVAGTGNDNRKIHHHSSLSKKFRRSKKKGAAILKNIKGVATSMSGLNKEHDYSQPPMEDPKVAKATSKWVKARQHGKSYKEFTALHMTQDIQAHEGSIWTMKFRWDGQILATAGEDKVIHVWEVQECEVMSAVRKADDAFSASGTPVPPVAGVASDRPPLAEITPLLSEKRKKIRSLLKKGNSIPHYVNMPETVFALSEKPICTFKGHQEDVLDLSWSNSQLLLSSSMDKTVRLWNLETKTCLKMFAHNDYVTCVQFNPVDESYFISGSLDGKVRIWDIPDRQVVDWIELLEMVTAVTYTPDGQGAVIGSHQGNCRFYTIDDYKLECINCVRMRTKSQSKKLPGLTSLAQTNKITGFQFCPSNQSEVLITSTDSRIRLYNGSERVQKYRGFRNTSSQISASFSPDGRYVISASEDSQVYIWKVEESKVPGGSTKKNQVTVLAHENFHCKDLTVAIPWPGGIKNEAPLVQVRSKRHTKRLSSLPHHLNTSPTGNDQDSLVGSGGRKQLPPVPKKNSPRYAEEDVGNSRRMMDPGIGVSTSFDSSDGETSSISGSAPGPPQSWQSPRFENGQGGQNTVHATAWGLVIVTASLEGEIRVYQNLGLPLKVGRR